VDQESEGVHALIGADLAKRHGESPKVVHAVAAHHEDIPPENILAVLVQAADTLSGARPGARREMLETYVKRLEDLERVALSFSGISKSYAIQAGREIRLIVESEKVNDEEATLLSREVAKKIEQATRKGATLIGKWVDDVSRDTDGRLLVKPRGGPPEPYDLLAVAAGVNTNALKLFQSLDTGFKQPDTVRTFIHEYYLGKDVIEQYLGEHTIHFFLLNIPGMDFAAIVPKGDYVTVALLGEKMDNELCDTFLNTLPVKACMPPGWKPTEDACHCAPRINLTGALHPYADRMVFIGDTAVSRLYKDGIGAAYRAAKYAAAAAVFHGIGEQDFRRYFWSPYHSMEYDNVMGKIIFAFSGLLKPRRFASDAVLRMMAGEQPKPAAQRRMSSFIWNMCTGSAPYKEILLGALHPAFWSQFLWYWFVSVMNGR
jgi:hypothetical protein